MGKIDIVGEKIVELAKKADYEGLPLSSETFDELEMECDIMCANTSLDHKEVLNDAIEKVKNAL